MKKLVNGIEYEMTPDEAIAFEASRAVDFNQLKQSYLKRVDTDVDAIMRDCIGERATEYQRAESQARAYKAASYSGTVPTTVRVWAETKLWTNQQAADDIIAQADAWIGAQDAIRENRLKTKEAYRISTTEAQLNSVKASWGGFVSYIRNALGV